MLALVLVGWTSSPPATTQMRDTRSSVKALYIYNFATLIDWPVDYRKGNFVIGVYGSTEGVYTELTKKYAGKAIGSQEIVVEAYSSSSEIDKAHILFVTEEKSSQVSSLVSKFKSKSTLIVTEKSGYLNKGAIINFVLDGSKQSFEISKSNAKKHNLVIASKLTSLAIKVVE